MVKLNIKGFFKIIMYVDTRPFYDDDYCLVTLLQGMCLKNMKSPLQAEECFKSVIDQYPKLTKPYNYLGPYAMSEIATLNREQGNLIGALELLERAK